MALSSCNNKSKNVPCQIIVYDEASTTKAYLISYNGNYMWKTFFQYY